jgi:hypothetical protein
VIVLAAARPASPSFGRACNGCLFTTSTVGGDLRTFSQHHAAPCIPNKWLHYSSACCRALPAKSDFNQEPPRAVAAVAAADAPGGRSCKESADSSAAPPPLLVSMHRSRTSLLTPSVGASSLLLPTCARAVWACLTQFRSMGHANSNQFVSNSSTHFVLLNAVRVHGKLHADRVSQEVVEK